MAQRSTLRRGEDETVARLAETLDDELRDDDSAHFVSLRCAPFETPGYLGGRLLDVDTAPSGVDTLPTGAATASPQRSPA